MLRAAEDDIVKDDALEGLTAVVTVRLAEPQFEGQTKEVLGTSAASRIVASVVGKELKASLTSPKRGGKQAGPAPCSTRSSPRPAPASPPGSTRSCSAARTRWRPPRCRRSWPTAAATTSSAASSSSSRATPRSAPPSSPATPSIQALLPIRGKILNVQKASVSDMLKNAECAAIIQVIGAGSGRTFDLASARYGKVILMADADVDGAHIRTLLLTLFFRYMRPMVEAGRVFAAVPPLHRIEVVNAGSKKNEVVYTYSEAELRKTVADLQRKGKRYKDPIQRYKGLGEMDADQLAETTMDPRHRTLRRVTIGDVEAAEQCFELLMGNEVAPRRDFIVDGAVAARPRRASTPDPPSAGDRRDVGTDDAEGRHGVSGAQVATITWPATAGHAEDGRPGAPPVLVDDPRHGVTACDMVPTRRGRHGVSGARSRTLTAQTWGCAECRRKGGQ